MLRVVVDRLGEHADVDDVLDEEDGHVLLVHVPEDDAHDEHRQVDEQQVAGAVDGGEQRGEGVAAAPRPLQQQQRQRRQHQVDARDQHDRVVHAEREEDVRLGDEQHLAAGTRNDRSSLAKLCIRCA